MNRRVFLSSMLAFGGALAIRPRAFGQIAPATTRPASSAGQSDAVRAAAERFLQTLAPERRARLTFAFPKGQSPTAISFDGHGHPGPPSTRRGRNVAFDVNGHLLPDDGDRGGPGGPGRGGPGGGPRDHGPNDHGPGDRGPRDHGPGGPGGGGQGGRMAAGEKFGDAVWTNFPVDNVARPGVQMGQFTAPERAAAHALLRTVLSPMGYQKVLDVMAADQLVADAGSDYAAGLDVYTLGLFGTPGATDPWMLQFGGHHLGLNVVFVGDRAVCAPLHTGILPAWFDSGGRIVRGLGRENDQAFDLLGTFSPGQLKAAQIDHDVSDLVFGPGRFDATLTPAGVRGVDLSGRQQELLMRLVGEWTGMLNDAHTRDRTAEIRKALPDTYFAWSGPTTHEPGREGGAYFRVHGPTLFIEHSPQGNQGGYKVHVHTVLRELGNDYAARIA